MGNEMSGHGGDDHGHSHGGVPCDGNHGAPAPAPASHGHSHGPGQPPCHGHGPAPAPAPAATHSHGGKACNHNHGGPAPAASHGHSHGGSGGGAGHGHSHGGNDGGHGHSHNGVPCHGHGGAGEGMDPHMARKLRAVELFMKTMMLPKLPVVFAHFHKTDKTAEQLAAAGSTVSGGVTVPNNADESMTRDEFREVVYAINSATARADRHGVVRPSEVADMEKMFLGMMGIKPASDDDDTVKIPQPLFLRFAGMIMQRIALQRYDAIPYLLEEWGLPPKCPKIPLTPSDDMRERITAYVYDQVVPFLTTFILAAVEENKDSESAAARCGLTAVVDSILAGLEEADTEFSKQAAAVVKRIPQEEVVKALKVDESDKDAHPRLVVFHVVTQMLTMLLGMEPETAKFVFKRWGIEFVVRFFDDAIHADGTAQQ